ncbi:MAG: hypothetical protein HC857_12510 [Synechococcales cyanobacterium RU_4_20]|nr:hypothetical protein [Synechococcales cyanobacterium RU_4_20]
MATPAELRHYLACWFQLGKSVQVQQRGLSLCPSPVINHGQYSQAFEDCWQQLQLQGLGQCFLEGTGQSLAELLGGSWDVSDCARCAMPIVQKVGGLPEISCPCHDLPNWPNTELPAPRVNKTGDRSFNLSTSV